VLGLLRPGILDGLKIVIAGGDAPAPRLAARCTELGATVATVKVDPFGGQPEAPTADVLVWDGTSVFGDSIQGVRAALDGAWLAIRATMGAGKIVLLAPPDGGAHAQAARAGLENLARTTSIEWARAGTRVVTLLGGEAEQVAEMTAYLVSPAGDYFSGTALRLQA
jgi:NAD(P)-dependent dehydrogenase (short-subunit alcohol dehydrogenase family)